MLFQRTKAQLRTNSLPACIACVRVCVRVCRYIRKAVWPTLLCALLSVAALVVPTTELGDRFSILLTLFLTAYAIQWVSTDRLPKTPKLTRWVPVA